MSPFALLPFSGRVLNSAEKETGKWEKWTEREQEMWLT